jgi:hypothetical protein
MAKRLQHRGGTTSQHSSFTGAVREVTVDTDKNTLVVHDGATAGGHPLATATNFKSTGIDDNATSTAITIDSSQNVEITGSVKGASDLNLQSNDGNEKITLDSSGTQRFRVDGSEKMRLTSTGLGIGTSTPTEALEVKGRIIIDGDGSGTNNGTLIIDGSATSSSQIRFYQDGTPKGYVTYWDSFDTLGLTDGSGNGLHFSPSTQRVGIGTSSPSSKLSIYSSDTTVYSASSVGGQDSGSTLKIQNNSNASNVFASIDFNTNNNRVVNRIVSSHGNSTVDGFLSFITEGGGTPAERMRIDSSGNVGIGETAPLGKVHIKQNDSGVTSAPTFADALFIEDDANTGITIATPTNGIGSIAFGDSGDNDIGKFQYQHSDNSMLWVVNASERMRITNSGNVGIGTSSPSTALDISGGLTIDGNNNFIEHNITRQTASTDASRPVIRLTAKNTGSDVTDGFGSAIQFRMRDDTANVELGAIGFIRDGADGSGAFIVGQDSQLLQSSPQFIVKSSGNVGIGTSSPTKKLHVVGDMLIGFAGINEYIYFDSTLNHIGRNTTTGHVELNSQGGQSILFSIGGTERMRITSGGDLLVGKTATGIGTAGNEFKSYGEVYVTRNNQNLGLFNRLNGDGQIFGFMHDSITEGTITISGATVAYNGFTGTHWSRFIDESKPDVLRGTVMESLDQMTDWYHAEFETSYTEKDADGNDVVKTTTQKKPYALKANEQEGNVITYNWNTEKKDEEGNDIIEQVQATIVKQLDVKHVMSKISDTVEAKNVYGVFSAWDNDDLINNDFYVASVGSFVVRIKAGQVVSKGDLLQSNGDGTAKVQADDIIRASTFAKVLSNTVIETYEDGSFIVPCSLMC